VAAHHRVALAVVCHAASLPLPSGRSKAGLGRRGGNDYRRARQSVSHQT
jgi:hypothetical protein